MPRTQRPDPNPFESRTAERTIETERHRAAGTQREQETDGATLDPASRELEHPGRGPVEPLDVVDRDDDRRRRGELLEHRQGGHCNRALAGNRTAAAGASSATSSASR